MLAVEDVPSLKVAELKDELKNIGLPVSGLKAALAARLTEYLEVKAAVITSIKSKLPQMAHGVAGKVNVRVTLMR